jgi:DNA-binding IclR family transcriptional regulator
MVLPSQPILGLIDGMEVLQLLASVGRPMSGVEISKDLKIEKTKVNRILKTLAFLGFTMPSSNRKYTLGRPYMCFRLSCCMVLALLKMH